MPPPGPISIPHLGSITNNNMGIIRGSSTIPHQELMLTQLSGSIMASANQTLHRGSDQILTITIIIRGSNSITPHLGPIPVQDLDNIMVKMDLNKTLALAMLFMKTKIWK